MFKRIFVTLASLRLTVIALAAALVLVFAGTLAQVKFGLWLVQEQYFQSWFIWFTPTWSWLPEELAIRIPVYPGGHLIGAILLVNLTASFFVRFKWSWRKLGIQLIHIGLVVMLAGGLVTDLFSVSSYMRLREGETKNYSQDSMRVELAVIDTSDPDQEKVTVIPQGRLMEGEVIESPSLPFRIDIKTSYRNSNLHMIGHGTAEGMAPAATQGTGARVAVQPLPLATAMEERNVMSAVLELVADGGESLGTWLVSDTLAAAQAVSVGDRTWSIQLRPARYYKPFSLTLLDFSHETYPGTSIPKDFSSTVMLNDEVNNEQRQVRIYMNHPLRYGGETYYQSGFEPDNMGSVLQVVRNPGYQTPYIACVIMSIGLIYQFTMHLIGFTRRAKASPMS